MNALTSPMAWVNLVFVLTALFVPTAKDLLTPEFEIAVLAVVNGVIAIIDRVKRG